MEVKEYIQTELGLIPSDWKVVPFHECFDIMPNNTFSRAELSNEGNVKNIHYGDILIQYNEIVDCESNDIPYLTEQAEIKAKHAFLENGDVVIADTAEDETVGKAVEIINADKPIVSGLHTIPCRPKFYDFASKWLGYYMNSQLYHKQLLPYITGTKVSAISKQSIKDTLIVIPPFEQQEKYVEYLSAIDELISSQEKLIEKKKAIKQGVMKELLTGKKRLDNFSGEWNKYRICDLFDYINGSSIENYFNSSFGYKVISIGNYSLDSRYIENAVFVDYSHKKSIENLITKQGDLTMILNDKTSKGTILGRVLYIDSDNKYVINQRNIILRLKNSEQNSRFFYHLLNSNIVRKRIIKIAKTGTQIYVNLPDVLELDLFIPDDMKEQMAIADVLADMDSEVFELEQKLEKYKQLKQAMMEQLLTGKIRLV